MHTQQKEAIFILAVFAFSLLIFCVMAFFYPLRVAFAAFSFIGITGFSDLIFYRKKSKMVLMDERDKRIHLSSAATAGVVLWVLTVITAAVLMFQRRFSGEICFPAYYLGYLLITGVSVLLVIRSVSILILYHRGMSNE